MDNEVILTNIIFLNHFLYIYKENNYIILYKKQIVFNVL